MFCWKNDSICNRKFTLSKFYFSGNRRSKISIVISMKEFSAATKTSRMTHFKLMTDLLPSDIEHNTIRFLLNQSRGIIDNEVNCNIHKGMGNPEVANLSIAVLYLKDMVWRTRCWNKSIRNRITHETKTAYQSFEYKMSIKTMVLHLFINVNNRDTCLDWC